VADDTDPPGEPAASPDAPAEPENAAPAETTEEPAETTEPPAAAAEEPAAAAEESPAAAEEPPAAAAPAAAAAAEPAADEPGKKRKRTFGGVAKATGSVILCVLGVLCLTLSPLAIWGRNLILNTDRYVSTLEPLASNPGVQQGIVNVVDQQVDANLDLSTYLNEALPPRAATALKGPLQSALSSLVNQITTKFVESKQFHTLWVTINRTAHQQIVYVLTGKQVSNPSLQVRNGVLYVDLSAVVDNVKDQLVKAGIGVAKNIPAVGTTLKIANVKGIESARRGVRALNTIADWLPFVGLALIAGGVLLARRWRRALVASALGVAVGMVVIGLGLFIGRTIYLNNLPGTYITSETSASVYNTVVRYLREGIRIVFVVALLVALGVWVSGPGAKATAVRRGVSRLWGKIHWRSGRGPFGEFLATYATLLRVAIVAVAFLILLLLNGLSLATFLVVVIIAALLLILLEIFRAPSAPSDETPEDSEATPVSS
jgi:hypothetical protein